MNTRSKWREATLGKNQDCNKIIVEWDGLKYEVRQPTLRTRSNIHKKTSTNGLVDAFDFIGWLVIYTTYVPGTDERVFDEQDFDACMNTYSGGFMDKLSEATTKLSNIDPKEKKDFLG